MNETLPKSPEQVKAEMAANRERTTMFLLAAPALAIVLGIPGILASRVLGEDVGMVLTYAGFGVLVMAFAWLRVSTSSCPACKEPFGRYFFGSVCPSCGVELS